MTDNMVIAIPSKGRPFGSTFRLVEKANIPVYVYVNKREAECYKTYLPEKFNIVEHNENYIGNIRRIITDYQKSLGNKALVLDDDIRAFFDEDGNALSVNYVIGELLHYENEYDVILLGAVHSLYKFQERVLATNLGIGYLLNASFYDKNIIFTDDDKMSEDTDAYLQLIKNKLKIGRPENIIIYHDYADNNSHFSEVWRMITKIKLYEKWGIAYSLVPSNNETVILGVVNEEYADSPAYSEIVHNIIEDVIKEHENNYALSEFIEYAKNALENLKKMPLMENPIRDDITYSWANHFYPERYQEKIRWFEKKRKDLYVPLNLQRIPFSGRSISGYEEQANNGR